MNDFTIEELKDIIKVQKNVIKTWTEYLSKNNFTDDFNELVKRTIACNQEIIGNANIELKNRENINHA